MASASMSEASASCKNDSARSLVSDFLLENSENSQGIDNVLSLQELESLLQSMEARAKTTKDTILEVLTNHHPMFATAFECSGKENSVGSVACVTRIVVGEVAEQIISIRESFRQIVVQLGNENSVDGVRT